MIRFNRGGLDLKTVAVTYPTRGLLSRYTFENTLNDTYGANNGWATYTAGTAGWTYGDGKLGNGFQTNATTSGTDKKTISTSDAALGGLASGYNTFSLSFWAKCTASDADIQMPLSFYNGATNGEVPIAFGGVSSKPAGSINGCLSSSGAYYNYDFRDNQWHHFAFTKTSATINVYSDNVWRYSVNDVYRSDLSRAFIGSALNSWTYRGVIDLVYYYNVALTTDEISKLYNYGYGI